MLTSDPGDLHHLLDTQRNGGEERYTDLTLPHRVYDGHIRAGFLDGGPATAFERYRAVRDATPANARALLETSPVTLVFGGWDSSRRARQGRWRSALVGEIVGFCADPLAPDRKPVMRGGARFDPVAMQVRCEEQAVLRIADGATVTKDHLGPLIRLSGAQPSRALAFPQLRGARIGTLSRLPPEPPFIEAWTSPRRCSAVAWGSRLPPELSFIEA